MGSAILPNPIFTFTFRQCCRKVSARRRHGGLGISPASAFVIQMLCLRQCRRRRCQSILRCTALHRLDRPAVKEHTAAVSRKGWETDDFEFCVDFRTVIGDLQCFAIERRALVDPQPLGIHIGEDAAEGVVNELFQRRFSSVASASLP